MSGMPLAKTSPDLPQESSASLLVGHAWRYSVPVPITDDQKQRRRLFAAYLKDAMRAAGYVRPSGDEDVPALSRMSGVADNILRRWLNEDGDPSLPNLRLVAPALGVSKRDLFVVSGQLMTDEVGLTEEPQPPEAPPTPEERIMADDVLSPDEKAALIQTYRVLRDRSTPLEESRRRRRA